MSLDTKSEKIGKRQKGSNRKTKVEHETTPLIRAE
jgi:hypothetical protein